MRKRVREIDIKIISFSVIAMYMLFLPINIYDANADPITVECCTVNGNEANACWACCCQVSSVSAMCYLSNIGSVVSVHSVISRCIDQH